MCEAKYLAFISVRCVSFRESRASESHHRAGAHGAAAASNNRRSSIWDFRDRSISIKPLFVPFKDELCRLPLTAAASQIRLLHGRKARVWAQMRWFRDNVGHGSWLALIALAINIALSFGHIHAIGGHHSEHGVVVAPSDGGPNHSDDGKTDDLCPICMAAAAISTGLAPTPPALPVEFAGALIDRAIEHAVTIPPAPRAAFHSRAPPIS
jgi:hypothetical protein